jgi:hypothetical protein
MEPLWTAEPGEWFFLLGLEGDYLLAAPSDDLESLVWIELDPTAVQQVTLEADTSSGASH